jgi:hypothetical protein
MSVRTDDAEYDTVGVDAAEMERYAEVTLDSGDVIVYDRDNEDAWIQAGTAIRLEFMA